MSTIKTTIKPESVLNFLQENFDQNISDVNFVVGGEMSQAFSFYAENIDFIIRVFRQDYAFKKDRYAYEHFKNADIPIPKIISIGEFDQSLFYAISEKSVGTSLQNTDRETLIRLIPDFIKIHDAMRTTQIKETGYGWWDENGDAKYKSWKESLLAKKDHVEDDLRKTKTDPSHERQTIEDVYREMVGYLKFVPEIRHLIHADLGWSNVVYDGKRITGVFDFANSMYGDFLYDVAWLDFWDPEIGYTEEFKRHFIEIKVDISNFNERIKCYQLHMGLGILGFFLFSEQKDKYESAKSKLLKLIRED